jgi:hypothetical protein
MFPVTSHGPSIMSGSMPRLDIQFPASHGAAPSCRLAIAPEPRGARWRLAAWAALALFCVGVTLSPWASGFADAPPRGPGDVELYNAEVARIRAGQGYYAAATAELAPRGYPTRSVFNWRMPLPMWLIGQFPRPEWGQAILAGIALAVLLAGFELTARTAGVRLALTTVLLLSGAVLPCLLGNLFVMPELWSGMLIALSLCLYGLDRPRAGLLAALAALFVRELAAPYCLLSLSLAAWRRQWREAAFWTMGLAAYAVCFAAHAHAARGCMAVDAVAHDHGWVRFGGAAFVLSACQVNAWLLLLPQWITAVYFAVAMLGFATWNDTAGARFGLTASLYVAAFGVVGQDFNQYWGSMIAPLFCFGVARGGAALVRLAAQARFTLPTAPAVSRT